MLYFQVLIFIDVYRWPFEGDNIICRKGQESLISLLNSTTGQFTYGTVILDEKCDTETTIYTRTKKLIGKNDF